MDASSARRLAQATLVGLRATLPLQYEAYGICGKGYILLPQRVPLDGEEIVAALVDIPKPALCAALALDGFLAIAVWPGTYWGSAEMLTAKHAMAQQSIAKHKKARLLFKVDGEDPVVLSVDELSQWSEQYKIVGLNLGFHCQATTMSRSPMRPRTPFNCRACSRVLHGLFQHCSRSTRSAWPSEPPRTGGGRGRFAKRRRALRRGDDRGCVEKR